MVQLSQKRSHRYLKEKSRYFIVWAENMITVVLQNNTGGSGQVSTEPRCMLLWSPEKHSLFFSFTYDQLRKLFLKGQLI